MKLTEIDVKIGKGGIVVQLTKVSTNPNYYQYLMERMNVMDMPDYEGEQFSTESTGFIIPLTLFLVVEDINPVEPYDKFRSTIFPKVLDFVGESEAEMLYVRVITKIKQAVATQIGGD